MFSGHVLKKLILFRRILLKVTLILAIIAPMLCGNHLNYHRNCKFFVLYLLLGPSK